MPFPGGGRNLGPWGGQQGSAGPSAPGETQAPATEATPCRTGRGVICFEPRPGWQPTRRDEAGRDRTPPAENPEHGPAAEPRPPGSPENLAARSLMETSCGDIFRRCQVGLLCLPPGRSREDPGRVEGSRDEAGRNTGCPLSWPHQGGAAPQGAPQQSSRVRASGSMGVGADPGPKALHHRKPPGWEMLAHARPRARGSAQQAQGAPYTVLPSPAGELALHITGLRVLRGVGFPSLLLVYWNEDPGLCVSY